jgi:hypothetical protein
MKELIRHKINRAVYIFLEAEVQFKGAAGFAARREGYVLQVAGCVGDVLACFSAFALAIWLDCTYYEGTYIVLFKQLTGMGSPAL